VLLFADATAPEAVSIWVRPDWGGMVTTVGLDSAGGASFAGIREPLKDAEEEPYRGYWGRANHRRRTVQMPIFFGSDAPFTLSMLAEAPQGWTLVGGAFEGRLSAGGVATVTSPGPGAFVGAVDPDGQLAWLSPIPPPMDGESFAPWALGVTDRSIHVSGVVRDTTGEEWLTRVNFDRSGGFADTCSMLSTRRPWRVHDVSFAGEITAVVMELEGVARTKTGSTEGGAGATAMFFAEDCTPLGHFAWPAPQRARRVRVLEKRVVVVLDQPTSAAPIEIRWYSR
jgi:hypothetical protein